MDRSVVFRPFKSKKKYYSFTFNKRVRSLLYLSSQSLINRTSQTMYKHPLLLFDRCIKPDITVVVTL